MYERPIALLAKIRCGGCVGNNFCLRLGADHKPDETRKDTSKCKYMVVMCAACRL
jgi:predicted metal-binding protein